MISKKISSLTALAVSLFCGATLAQSNEVRVAWYGGNWGDAFQTCIADPYTKATGIKVVPEIGTSNTTLAKLRQQKDRPLIDVAFLDGGVSELAEADGLLRPIDASKVANLDNLETPSVYKSGSGDVFAGSIGYYSLGITYDKREVESPPQSWDDLWKDDYAGAVIIPSPANSSGIPFIVFLANIWNVPMSDLAPVYERLKKLDVAAYFDSSGAASNAFQSGEAVIGAHFNVGAWAMIDAGLPIGFSVPKEGVWATDARVHLVKGSPNPDAAEQFINQAFTPESAACLAKNLYLGPAVKGVEVDASVREKMPWGDGGSIENLNLLNWSEINQLRAPITDAWNREVAKR